jgi:hypothetical protein
MQFDCRKIAILTHTLKSSSWFLQPLILREVANKTSLSLKAFWGAFEAIRLTNCVVMERALSKNTQNYRLPRAKHELVADNKIEQ